MKELKSGKKRWALFGMKDFVIDVANVGERSSTYKDMLAELPDSMCRYLIYDHEFKTADGRQTSKLYSIFW